MNLIKVLNFDKKEISELFLASIAIAFIISFYSFSQLTSKEFYFTLAIVFWIVLLSFATHEIAHKIMAQHYKFFARFEISLGGLGFALLLKILTSITLIIPGAVKVYQTYHLKPKRQRYVNAMISIAGPLTNIAIALIATILNLISPNSYVAIIAYFNALLAVFNLLPIPPLDGFKIIRWSFLVYGAIFIFAAALLIINL